MRIVIAIDVNTSVLREQRVLDLSSALMRFAPAHRLKWAEKDGRRVYMTGVQIESVSEDGYHAEAAVYGAVYDTDAFAEDISYSIGFDYPSLYGMEFEFHPHADIDGMPAVGVSCDFSESDIVEGVVEAARLTAETCYGRWLENLVCVDELEPVSVEFDPTRSALATVTFSAELDPDIDRGFREPTAPTSGLIAWVGASLLFG